MSAQNIAVRFQFGRHVHAKSLELLHIDLDAIKTAWDSKMQDFHAGHKKDLLCKVCGYPSCKCTKCGSIAKGRKSSNGNHSCWLGGRGPGKKAKGWIQESEDQLQARIEAWKQHGVINDLPVFSDGHFCWMD